MERYPVILDFSGHCNATKIAVLIGDVGLHAPWILKGTSFEGHQGSIAVLSSLKRIIPQNSNTAVTYLTIWRELIDSAELWLKYLKLKADRMFDQALSQLRPSNDLMDQVVNEAEELYKFQLEFLRTLSFYLPRDETKVPKPFGRLFELNPGPAIVAAHVGHNRERTPRNSN